MATYNQQLLAEWQVGQPMVRRVCFFHETTARRFARFLNRHLGNGRAAVEGACVIVGALPLGVMKRAYLLFGALPNYEEIF